MTGEFDAQVPLSCVLWCGVKGSCAPEDFPGLAVEGQHLETHLAKRVEVVVRAGRLLRHNEFIAVWNCGGKVNVIAPHDR